MRRFSILALMGLVLALAVGLAALRGANDYWAGGLMMAAPLLFGIALLGALCGREEKKPGRIGFVILGGGYFALAFLGLSELNLSKLPTSMLIQGIHSRVAEPQSSQGSIAFVQYVEALNRNQAMAVTPPQAVPLPPNRLKVILPGAADYVAFTAVGHCLFALLAGLVGAGVAVRFDRIRRRREEVSSANGQEAGSTSPMT